MNVQDAECSDGCTVADARAMDANGLALCRLQGRIFRESAQVAACSSAVFVRRFMRSSVAAALDAQDNGIFAQTASQLVKQVQSEYENESYGTQKYPLETLYWMGYFYRYWAYAFDMESVKVYRMIGARELCGLYLPYHAMDIPQAIERICEAKGLPLCRRASVEEGVRALRQIRARRAEAGTSSYEYYVLDW